MLARDPLLAAHLARERLAAAQLLELGLPAHAAVASQHVVELVARAGVRARRARATGERARSWPRRCPRARGARGGRRALVLRRRRRPTGRCSRSSAWTACSTSTARAGSCASRRGSGCTALVRELLAPRARAAEPRRHRRAVARGRARAPARTARARGSATSRRPSRRWSSCSPTAPSARVEGGDELLAARVGLGALGVVAAVTLRCVPAFRLHAVDEPLPLEEVLADLDAHVDGQRPLRAVHVPALAAGADADEQPHRRARARRGGRGSSGCRTSRSTTTPSGCSTARRGAPRGRSRASTASRAAPPRSASASTESFRRLRQPAARALRGDGVRAAAGARRRGGARVPRDPRAPPRLLPDRAALLGRRRRAALARARARDGVRRRARVRGHGLRGALPRGRGAAARLGRPPALGQALLPRRRGARPALPALGRLRGDPRARSTRAGASSTPGSRARSGRRRSRDRPPALDAHGRLRLDHAAAGQRGGAERRARGHRRATSTRPSPTCSGC